MGAAWKAIAVAGGFGLSLLAAGTADAAVTLKFSGDCADCTGAGGTLTLQNLPTGALTKADFISFVYQSNLISFQIKSSDVVAVMGSIDPNNLSTSYIDIIQMGGTGWEFDRNADGTWSVSSDITMGNPHPKGGAGGGGGGGGAPFVVGDGADGAPNSDLPPSDPGFNIGFFTGAGDSTGFVDDFGGDGGFVIDNLAPGVPEPAAWALMLTGFTGLGALLRGRRRLAVIETA